MTVIALKLNSCDGSDGEIKEIAETTLHNLKECELQKNKYMLGFGNTKSVNGIKAVKFFFEQILKEKVALTNCHKVSFCYSNLDTDIINLLVQLFENQLLSNLEILNLTDCSLERPDLINIINVAKAHRKLVELNIGHNYHKHENEEVALQEDFELIQALFDLEKDSATIKTIDIYNTGFSNNSDSESGFFLYNKLYNDKSHEKIKLSMVRPDVYKRTDCYKAGEHYDIHNTPFSAYSYVFKFIDDKQISDAALYGVNSLEKLKAAIQFLATNSSLTKIALQCTRLREDEVVEVLEKEHLNSNICLQKIHIHSADSDFRYQFHEKVQHFCNQITQRNEENITRKQAGLDAVEKDRAPEELEQENKQLLLKIEQLNAVILAQKQLVEEKQNTIEQQDQLIKASEVKISDLQEKLAASDKSLSKQKQEVSSYKGLVSQSSTNLYKLMQSNHVLKAELKENETAIRVLSRTITKTTADLHESCGKGVRLIQESNRPMNNSGYAPRLFSSPNSGSSANINHGEFVGKVDEKSQPHQPQHMRKSRG